VYSNSVLRLFHFSIIAVHGLAANPVYTWVKTIRKSEAAKARGSALSYLLSNEITRDTLPGRITAEGDREVIWLKDLLPDAIPDIRVLHFNYASNYILKAPKENLRSIAQRLVQAVHDFRKADGTQDRPIVFLGHSFGGVVIEEASFLLILEGRSSNYLMSYLKGNSGKLQINTYKVRVYKHNRHCLFGNTSPWFRGDDVGHYYGQLCLCSRGRFGQETFGDSSTRF